jgi:DNA topoisomerase IA
MDVIKRVDFEAITQQAIQEGATYPVPRLLENKNVMQILANIAKTA